MVKDLSAECLLCCVSRLWLEGFQPFQPYILPESSISRMKAGRLRLWHYILLFSSVMWFCANWDHPLSG